ncbi:ComEC/Rec2 family competence protein [Enteractinococcus coprophilus]|uniref:ComEC/Rec2 family competence protein n=1 Tax=Enteractinococcus coprophilus TaxID=1027633 RepID=UPI001476C5B3|nr:ComEC/Rec2 family competence protein [Enteractinococcus coprophilus]
MNFVSALDTARMSVRLVTDPVEREGPFGNNWFVTAEVEAFGKDLTPTPHPAKIVISGDTSLVDLGAEDQACFFGRVTDNESSVFVQATATIQPGTCADGSAKPSTTGRDTMRATLRAQASRTISYAPELLPGLILGDRSQQSEHVDHAMKVSGLSHLSAVSGAHTSLIASAATILFRSLRLPRSVVIAAFLATLLLFVQIVGMQPSIIRAATMGAIGAWALFFGRGSQALPILALSTIVILTVSPELIHEVGFQLSVAATAGIVLGAQPLEAWFRPLLEKFLPNFWATMLSSSFAISATAQLACQPLLLTFIDYVSAYSLLANLLATPLLPLITVPGTVAAGICVVAPGIAQGILHIVALPTAAVGWIATRVAELPGSMLPWPEGPGGTLLIVLHWAASSIVLLKLLRRQRRSKPAVKIDAPRSRWTGIVITAERGLTAANVVQLVVVLAAVVAHGVVFWPLRPTMVDANWDIVGCDVGQGDMFLVRTGTDSAMVIDTGPDPPLARQCLEAARIRQVDLLVVTHLHADHVGGLQGVVDVATPQEMIYSTGSDPTYDPAATDLPDTARQIDQPVVGIIDHAQDDPEHPVQLRWSILSADSMASNENNASIVLFLEIYRHGGVVTALFTGDLEEDYAGMLLADQRIPAPIDILKLSHHGAKNGGTALIEHTAPTMALIGVGEDNTYGHPHAEILEALGPRIQLRRTDVDGTFAVTFQHSPAFIAMER